MKCAYCDNPVKAWRVLAGSRFCSRDHQRRHHARSARTLRDMEDIYGSQSLAEELYKKRVEAEPKRAQPGSVITVMALFTVSVAAMLCDVPVTSVALKLSVPWSALVKV